MLTRRSSSSAIFGTSRFGRASRSSASHFGVAMLVWCDRHHPLRDGARAWSAWRGRRRHASDPLVRPHRVRRRRGRGRGRSARVSTVAAVAIATGANVYFGMRMLTHRLAEPAPGRVRVGLELVARRLSLAAGLSNPSPGTSSRRCCPASVLRRSSNARRAAAPREIDRIACAQVAYGRSAKRCELTNTVPIASRTTMHRGTGRVSAPAAELSSLRDA